ncbi:TRAP transporter large permease subunit [Lichenibacterium minor]|uniref:TRAP transporter large permease subunit n=1 Tax=Lichenibacterium minor TaxID=2316528 RepID=A0A4Q2TYK6_9HYPH|nr:TRAP transporter large permease subunit [Lichenibacterium minor]RYC29173.1 TRAP transporter large permease subunit [Lichenibacterium minor]
MAALAQATAPPAARSFSFLAERAVLRAMEAVAAVLVVAEVVILLMGVVSRFVFDRPLVWSDELASLLFLWLAMVGAAIALSRGAHMRLSTVTAMLSPAWRLRLDALAVGVPLVFLALLFGPARDYVEDQGFIETPALSWPGSIRAYAMLAGIGLMLLIAALKLLRLGWRDLLVATAALGTLGVVLWAAASALTAMGNWNLLIFFVLLVGGAVLLGVPIAFAFGLATAAYLLTTTSTPLPVVVGRLDEGMSSLILLAVPLFVLLGQLVDATGMARAMVAFLAALIGHVRGGLSYVLLGGMLLVSGISGSKAADMAAVAPVLFPEMKRRGLDEGEMVSLLAASGAMAETIPPSLVLIAIASVTGVSISALFTGGLLPGIVLALALAFLARQRTHEAPTTRAPLAVVGRTFLVGLPALVLPVLIRTAVVEGVATATEVSTIGIAYCAVVGVGVYRQFDWRRAYPMLVETATLSGAILFIIGAATGMAWALTQSGFSQSLARVMGSVPGGQWGFLAISVLAFIVLGSVLEGIPAMVLFGPLLFPIARQIGVNEVHYAIVIILAMGIGLFAPPFGLGYYTACTIGKVHPDIALKKIWPYLGVLTLTLLLLAAVPWFSTGFLP